MSQETVTQNQQPKVQGKPLPPEELAVFCEQVSLILNSGVSLYDGMEALADNYKDTGAYASFERIQQGVIETGSLYYALKSETMFPPYLIEMVQIGETTGKLDTVMGALSMYYTRAGRIRRSIQNAVLYPLGLLAMMALVILVLVWKVLPIFDQVYKSLGAELPESAVSIMHFGMGVGNVVLVVVAILIVAVLAVVVLLRTKFRQAVMDLVGKLLPPIRRITASMLAEKFASNLGMMLGSGYPLEEALPLIANVFEEPAARERIHICADEVRDGVEFPVSIAKSKIFHNLHNKMIHMGFLAGKTDHVMTRLATLYEEELDNDISKVVAMIEPAMVALLSVIIGAILLSVMLPMVSIMSSIL